MDRENKMSCVVGIVQDGVIYMGGDSLAIDDDSNQTLVKDEKVFYKTVGLKSKMLMGFVGNYRIGNIMKHTFRCPKRLSNDTVEQYIYDRFIVSLKEAVKDEKFEDTSLLLGYEKNLYVIEDDFSVVCPVSPYTSIGHGAPYALGALSVLFSFGTTPQVKIEMSLSAASDHSAAVKPPYLILCL